MNRARASAPGAGARRRAPAPTSSSPTRSTSRLSQTSPKREQPSCFESSSKRQRFDLALRRLGQPEPLLFESEHAHVLYVGARSATTHRVRSAAGLDRGEREAAARDHVAVPARRLRAARPVQGSVFGAAHHGRAEAVLGLRRSSRTSPSSSTSSQRRSAAPVCPPATRWWSSLRAKLPAPSRSR
jgi:hypothetical protein